MRAQLETTTEERDEYQNSVIKLEQQLKEAKDERDAATKAAGVIQAKLDAANEDIEKNAAICVDLNFTGAFVLNRRVDLHAIDATPARWRGDVGSLPLDGAPDTLVDFHTGRDPRGEGRLHQDAHPDAQGKIGSKTKSY